MDPFPSVEKIMKVYAPADVLVMDLDDPKVWNRSTISPHRFTAVHWGGGPNPAGEPIEEPTMTFRQKLAVQFARVKTVVRVWESWHINGRNMSAIAYCGGIDAVFGRLYQWRGFKHNGGQYGSINTFTMAIVFILGFGQYPSRRAWRTLGFLWLFSGPGVQHVGHRFFNDWPQTLGPTSCPGDRIDQGIKTDAHIRALGKLSYRTPAYMRGVRVRALTLRLEQLGFNITMRNKFDKLTAAAVMAFRAEQGLPIVAKVNKETWEKLAAAI